MKIELPIRTYNPLNNRRHWRTVWARAKGQRQIAYLAFPAGIQTPVTITLRRLGKKIMDGDGLAASFKAIRDGIADKLGVDDGSDRVTFVYEQAKAKDYAVEIEFP